MITKEQQEALHTLECSTHTLWKPDAASALTRPFGFECKVREHVADGDRNPKGLTLANGAKSAIGAASWDISGQIASHYNLRPEGKLGRGFQVRADCEAIRRHLNDQT